MRILIYTRAFPPLIGGLELNVAQLARGLAEAGHEIVVYTTTPGRSQEDQRFPVLRNAGALDLLRHVHWCDLYYQPNISLRGLWPLLVVRRPWVVSHHSWYRRPDGRIGWQDRLKRFLLRFASGSISVSRSIAEDLGTPSVVIGNAYDDQLFRQLPGEARARDLLFVGRLVSDKGVDILLDALAVLAREGVAPDLTIVGDGPERQALQAQAVRLGLADRVVFAGTVTGEDLVRMLNRHRILVVPSRYAEPFGIVALEGVASGCIVVGSERGGLKDAIGPCGMTFPNGDSGALARVLGTVLADPMANGGFRRHATAHLEPHRLKRVLDRYLELFEAAVHSHR